MKLEEKLAEVSEKEKEKASLTEVSRRLSPWTRIKRHVALSNVASQREAAEGEPSQGQG